MANQSIVKLVLVVLPELTSNSKKSGCSSTCNSVMSISNLHMIVRGLNIGYYLWVYRTMKYRSTTKDITEPIIVTTKVRTSTIVFI